MIKKNLYKKITEVVRKDMIISCAFAMISNIFYYQSVFMIKAWGYGDKDMKIEFFKKVFAGKKEIIKGSIFFFAANLLFSLFSDYFRNKSLVNCKNYLRRRVIMIIEKKGEESSKMKTMVNNLLTEIELFSPLFTFIPHKIFVSLFGILVNILYLKKFPTDRLINYFLVISSTSIFVSNLFTYSEQKKNSRRQNLYRIKENASIENFIDKKMTKWELINLLKKNETKNLMIIAKNLIIDLTINLPVAAIPGLNVFFCLIQQIRKGEELKNFAQAFSTASMIQTIFWKIKDLSNCLSEIGKMKNHGDFISIMEKKVEQKKMDNINKEKV